MILSHRTPYSFDMSEYRAMWIHFRSNCLIIIDFIFSDCDSELQFSPANGCSTLRKVEELMPRGIRST